MAWSFPECGLGQINRVTAITPFHIIVINLVSNAHMAQIRHTEMVSLQAIPSQH